MKAMILAAGRGERMRPITDRIPKPLIRVNGRSLLEHQLSALMCAGIRDVVINVAYRGRQIREAIGKSDCQGMNITFSDEGNRALETGGGILKALSLLGNDPFLVVNGDIYTEFPYSNLRNRLHHTDDLDLAHLVMVDNPEHNRDGDFCLQNSRVDMVQGSRYTYAGIGVFRPELFTRQAEQVFPLAPLLESAIRKKQVSGEYFSGLWCDVGTPERLQELEFLLAG